MVLFGLLQLALLTVAALVIDIGYVRASARRNQSIADLSVLAAGRPPTSASTGPKPAAREAVATVTAESTRATVKVALVAKCENLKRGLFSQARRG